MIRSFILAAVLSAAMSATAWGQTSCKDMWQLRMDTTWEQANAAFDAATTEADDTYREELQTASAVYAQALASAEAAYEGSLYWAAKSAEPINLSSIAEPMAAAAAKRTHDRNAAHREWASSVSNVMSRWSASMEKAETRRSVFIGTNVPLIEEQLSDCR